jgi:hypothetical protein
MTHGHAFNRLEGTFRGEDGVSMYFVSTSGGDTRGPDGDGGILFCEERGPL